LQEKIMYIRYPSKLKHAHHELKEDSVGLGSLGLGYGHRVDGG
jgi:hypothetical protein